MTWEQNKILSEAGEMALAVLVQDLGSNPSTYMVSKNHP